MKLEPLAKIKKQGTENKIENQYKGISKRRIYCCSSLVQARSGSPNTNRLPRRKSKKIGTTDKIRLICHYSQKGVSQPLT